MDKDSGYEYKPRRIEDMSDRALRVGDGRISGLIACGLGILSFLGVLCFLFPSYLTIADMRGEYNVGMLRYILMAGMWASLTFGLLTFALGRQRRLGAVGVLFTALAFALGGYSVKTGAVHPVPLSLGLDWMILDMVGSVVLFTFIEKIFPKYKEQAILRPEWKLDLSYFCLNHLIFSVILLVGNYFVSTVFGWAANAQLQAAIRSLPVAVQFLILMCCADLVLYWSHRAFHVNPRLWKIHAVHHSVEHMDWLAGSRNHFLEALIDRSLAMIPLYLIGPDKAALDAYVIFAGIQAVLVHANLGLSFGPLKYVICTPQYHHWHHSSDAPAIDTNFAIHLPVLDMIFGTYHMPGDHWPVRYGTTKPLPRHFIGQLFYPFTGKDS